MATTGYGRYGRYGAHGRGINSGALLGLIAATDRREQREADAQATPERQAFRAEVRRIQLRSRIDAGTAGGYSTEDIAHAREALARIDAH